MMLDTPLFVNRIQAGVQLAQVISTHLRQIASDEVNPIPIVYALPRGGVPVAVPIARSLNCPLTVEVAKKISHPHNPELATGAVTASGSVIWAKQRIWPLKNPGWRSSALNTAINAAKSLAAQLSPACPQVNAEGAILILVDDGIATGMTIAAAATALKRFSPAKIWLCAPVAPLKLLPWLQKWGDRSIVLATPKSFMSVSNFYTEFPQVQTEEVLNYLQEERDRGMGGWG